MRVAKPFEAMARPDIEVLMVVMIILITASVPTLKSLQRRHIPAHETSVIADIRAIHEAEMMFAKTHPNQGFTSELATLANIDSDAAAPMIDNNLASGRKCGYIFSYTAGEKGSGAIRSYSITAVPVQVGKTGWRRFYSDESGEVRYNASGSANASSPTIR